MKGDRKMRRLSENQKRGGCDFVKDISGTTVDRCPFTGKIWDWGGSMEADVTYDNGEQLSFTTPVNGTRTDTAINRLLYDIRRDYLDPDNYTGKMKTRFV